MPPRKKAKQGTAPPVEEQPQPPSTHHDSIIMDVMSALPDHVVFVRVVRIRVIVIDITYGTNEIFFCGQDIARLLDAFSVEKARLVCKSWRTLFSRERVSKMKVLVQPRCLTEWQQHIASSWQAFTDIDTVIFHVPMHMSLKAYGRSEQQAWESLIGSLASKQIKDITLRHTLHRRYVQLLDR